MENDFHQWLQSNINTSDLIVPLGDDAAVIDWSKHDNCVVTSDLLADGVHFDLREATAHRIGRKCLAVNLSDVAAMAATPIAAVVSFLLPKDTTPSVDRLAEQLLEGMIPLANEFKTTIAGGDTNVWPGKLAVNVTMLAATGPSGALRRDQAQPGDLVMVTGSLGGSILGHHFDFQPKIIEARKLHERYKLTAGMDVSDGLALDASRMAQASGCGIELDQDAIPISEAAQSMAAKDGRKSALQRALGDGEDFELLFTANPEDAQQIVADQMLDVPVTIVGRCIEMEGLYQSTDAGPKPLEISGWEHG